MDELNGEAVPWSRTVAIQTDSSRISTEDRLCSN
jgi:hypothetical protein